MRCTRLTICFMLAIAWCLPSYAADLVPEIEVEGNEKTQISYIQFLVQDCIKDHEVNAWSDLQAAALQQCIFDSKVFRTVDVDIDESVIRIKVVERWTIIPIPFLQAGQNSNSAGILLLDTNFLGQGKQAMIGGATGDRGNSFFLSYRDPAIFFSDWTASTSFAARQVDYLRYDEDVEVDGYTYDGNSVALTVGYKLHPSLEIGTQLQVEHNSYQVLEPYNLVPADYRYTRLCAYLNYDQTDFHFYFQEGQKLKVRVATQISRNDEMQNVADAEFGYEWQKAVFTDHALQIKFDGRIIDSDDIRDSYKLGGNPGYRGVEPGSIWAHRSYALAIDYKIPVFDSRWGVWTVGPFVDQAVFREYDTDNTGDSTAYGGVVYLFLKGIAIPGIGIVAGRNNDYLGNFVNLTIGFGFD